MSENELIQEIVKGSQPAFLELYNKYSSKVYNLALSYSKNEEDAEEITQDVFIRIHKSADSFKGNSRLSTWIYRITINAALNFIKKKNKFTNFKNNLSEVPTIEFEHPGVILENKENSKALYMAMDCLPERQKTAFILSYIEELPRQEVADVMENTLKGVESLLQRAKKNMRVELEKVYPNRRKSNNHLSK